MAIIEEIIMKKIFIALCLFTPLIAAALSGLYADVNTGFSDTEIKEIVTAHNKYRAELNIPPLKWSEKLAQNAQVWANHLASQRRMYHSSGTNEGENLWMGTTGYYSLTNMVDSWGAEKRYYRNGVFPDVSSSGNWADVGHYTQVIWRNTTEVGCAQSTGGGYDYFVCRYLPPGNYMREQVY